MSFGRVPFFFYGLQWIAAHLAGIAITAWQGNSIAPYFMNFVQIVSLPHAPEMGGPLWLTHACWIAATVLLHVPCRWYAEVKARRRDFWLSYL